MSEARCEFANLRSSGVSRRRGECFKPALVEAGDHDVWLQGAGANVWGCEGEWGDLDIVVMPSGIEGLEVHQTPDQRSGCPPSAAAGARLIEHAFTVQQDSLLLVTGHIIRNAAGRQDLHLFVDSRLADRSLTFTSSAQWDDATVFWS